MFRERWLASTQVSDWHNNASTSINLPSRSGTPGPNQIPGLIFWLSADRITGKNNGDTLGTWADTSGNNRNFASASATWNTNRTPKGGPAVVSTSTHITIASFMATAAPSGAELFFYFRPTVTDNNFMVDWGTDSLQDHWPYSGTQIYSDFGSSGRKSAGSHIALSTWYAMSVYSVASDWGVYKTNSLVYSTGSNTVAWSGNTHMIGNGSEIAEFFAFNRKLASQERTAMFTYLNRHA